MYRKMKWQFLRFVQGNLMDRKNSLMYPYVFDHVTRCPAEISCTKNVPNFGPKRCNTGAEI